MFLCVLYTTLLSSWTPKYVLTLIHGRLSLPDRLLYCCDEMREPRRFFFALKGAVKHVFCDQPVMVFEQYAKYTKYNQLPKNELRRLSGRCHYVHLGFDVSTFWLKMEVEAFIYIY